MVATIRGGRGKERGRNRKKGGRTEGRETKKGGWERGRGERNHKLRKNVGENQKDEKHQTNVGKPNERMEKLKRNLKTQGWEVVVVVAGGLISIRCR